MKVVLCNDYPLNKDNVHIQTKFYNAVALGNFDGVHKGHAELIRALTERNDMYSCVYTFEHHPDNILTSSHKNLYITDNAQKTEIFRKMNINYVCFEDFEKVKDMTPEQFIDEVLIGCLDCGYVVCGFNFRFGKNGSGDSNYLKSELEKRGIECRIIPPVMFENEVVSSTRIRELIEVGNMELANKLLGRPFYIQQRVISGMQIGRTLGIPTINQSLPEYMVKPKNGVYACNCKIGDKFYHSVCNIGTKPTVGGNKLLAETHILDYSGDLYGHNVEVHLFKHLRDEIHFSSLDELKNAICKDIENTEKYFISQI